MNLLKKEIISELMKKAEAISILESQRQITKDCGDKFYIEALDYAIKSLKKN